MNPGRYQLSPDLKRRIVNPYSTENPQKGFHNEMELLTIQHELRHKNKEFRILHDRFQILTKRFKEMVFNHEKLMEQMDSIHSRNENLQKENIQITTDLQTITWEKEKWKEHEETLKELEEEKVELKKYISHLENILKGGEENPYQDPMILRKEIEELKAERIAFENKMDQVQREQFIKIEELQLKIQTLENEKKQFQDKFQEKNNQISQFSSSNYKLIHENKKLEEENRILKNKVVPTYPKLIKEIEELRKFLKELKENFEGKEKENQELKEFIINLQRDQKNIIFERNAFKRKYEDLLKKEEKPIIEEKPKIRNILKFTQQMNKFCLTLEKLEMIKPGFPFAHPVPTIFKIDFFSCEDSLWTKGITAESMQKFQYSYDFEIEMNDIFVVYCLNEMMEITLYAAPGGKLKELGIVRISLKELVEQNQILKKKVIIQDRNIHVASILLTAELEKSLKSIISNKNEIYKLYKR